MVFFTILIARYLFKFVGNQIDFTTYRNDFMSPGQGKLIPNSVAIDNVSIRDKYNSLVFK